MTRLRTLALAGLSMASVYLVGCSAAESAGSASSDAGGSTFDAIYTGTLAPRCKGCHAPGAAGSVVGETETTLDFSTVEKAYTSLKGKSAGMGGNFKDCNGVAFVVPGDASKSLLVAAIESATRKTFSSGACTEASVSPMEVKTIISAAQVKQIKDWINAGAAR